MYNLQNYMRKEKLFTNSTRISDNKIVNKTLKMMVIESFSETWNIYGVLSPTI